MILRERGEDALEVEDDYDFRALKTSFGVRDDGIKSF
jgi:hypothetical protein